MTTSSQIEEISPAKSCGPASRIPQIDLLRGVAVVLVVFRHISLAGSLVWGILAARMVEIPALYMRDRLFPSLAGSHSGLPK